MHGGINYGYLTGTTSWVKHGYGLDASMDYMLKIQITTEDTLNDLWNKYKIELVMSEVPEISGEVATQSELFQI